jgi:CheY-like chemotaxis protein
LARKILLADDSVTAQNMGRKILADAGYDVVTVNNGSAALKRITEIKPDLIVLDVYMPGYSGLEVCQRLKDAAATAHIPVLLTVGKLEPFKPEEARRVKADAHIVKPFEASELLTAIMRLEERMVPQQSEGSRFSTSVSGVERFSGEGNGRTKESKAGADTGWKSRLGFPSKKKKEETEEPEAESENLATEATFRDFRKAKGSKEPGGDARRSKTGASAPFTVKEPLPPGQEPGLVPDIPRDITPEELDALSALAEKLDGPGAAGVAEAKKEIEAPAPVVEAALSIAPAASVVEGKSEAAVPAAVEVHQHESKVPENQVPENQVPENQIPENQVQEAQHPETPATVVAVAANTAVVAEEPAPADRGDEPKFAAAPGAVEQVGEEKIDAKPAAAVAKSEAAEAEEPTPSAEDLAEALRLLTPATANLDVPTVSSPGTPVAAGATPAEELARSVGGGPRWIAEPVALTSEESAISLEAEMFSTFAATFAAASGGERGPAGVTTVSAIAAAVENRLAEAELAASAKALSEKGTEGGSAERLRSERSPSEHGSQTAPADTPVEAPAEVVSASNAASPVVDAIEPEKIAPEKLEGEQKDSPAKSEETPAEEVAAATFADAVSKDAVEVSARQNGESVDSVNAATAAMADENQDSSSDSGGQDSMGKDVKAKSGKSNWRQIHSAPASAAANSDVVEAAKQAENGTEDAPKVMAAAAAAEGTASPSATDASTIASIVDSVMADLRPKIVEEIARKLAGK